MSNHSIRKAWWPVALIGVVVINLLAAQYHQRFDLTQEKRYSLSKPTKSLLLRLDSTVSIDLLLTGNDLPAVVKKFRNAVTDFLSEAKEYAGKKLQVHLVNPYAETGDTAKLHRLEDSLYTYYGLFPVQLNAPEKVGDKLEISKLIHGAVVHYGNKSVGVDFLKGAKSFGTSPEELATLYNNVEASIEYRMTSAIEKITQKEKPVVAYAMGHGEGWGYNVDDAVRTLAANYVFDTLNIKEVPYIPKEINALIVLKPTKPFTDADKLKIDQFVVRGGKLFWMVDNMYAEFDSLYKSQGFVAFDRGLNLEDILFNYGVRLNQTLLQDMQSDQLPQVGSQTGQQRLVNWPFFPLLNGTNHPISKNLDVVRAMFPQTLDTVEAEGIHKTFLLQSSNNSRVLAAPAKIDFEFLQIAPDEKEFRQKNLPVAVLLEGRFKSLYEGRVSKAMQDSLLRMGVPFQGFSESVNKMIVVADGDIAMNQFSPSMGPLPMGMNVFTRYTYANKDFFTNCVEYLVNPSDILQTRAKEVTLRLLDAKKVAAEKMQWQAVNILLPIALIILFGVVYQQVRKRKYASA